MFLKMRLYITFLIQFTLTIIVRSDTGSLFEGTNSDFSNLDSATSASMFSSDGGDGFSPPVVPDLMPSYEANSNILTNANGFDMGETPGSVPASEQSLDSVANAGAPCVSGIDDLQTIGKFRAARRDGTCSAKTGERETGEGPSDGSSNLKPIDIPNAFPALTGEPNNMFYPSENQDECPSSLYGTRKTPMCDSGFGDDFMKYSVLGFVALDIIEGCLPCTYIEPCRYYLLTLV